ncbi:MAG: metal ABC transporter ATP-binding protein [Desulfobacteraceae bacterium]|nr:metal ABC transporter ATP-binding protein [Desulfobacteraceae bacterium]
MSVSIADVENLTVQYGDTEVLSTISFHVAPGDFLAVVGPNGSGKTTLVKSLLGLVEPTSGSISLLGQKPSLFDQWNRIGYLPQISGNNHKGFPATVREIVASGRLALKRFPRRLTACDHAAVTEILDIIGITDLADRKIDRLSGGQRQRVLLARSMVAGSEVLFLDEPTSALDPATRDNFYQLLQDINQIQGRTIVMITHDSGTVGAYADKFLYIDRTVIFFGDFSGFCRSPAMTAHFGGHAQHLICGQHEEEKVP